MIKSFFPKGLSLSVLGHLAVLGIFSVSFGTQLPDFRMVNINSRGAILSSNDFNQSFKNNPLVLGAQNINRLFKKNEAVILSKAKSKLAPLLLGSIKPMASLAFSSEKIIFSQNQATLLPLRNKPVVMLYPALPAYFKLFFADRQTVHLELEFKVTSASAASPIVIQRKASSGNLEADLLSMRYLSHYLFIQRSSFSPDKWQSVKIDLSTKND